MHMPTPRRPPQEFSLKQLVNQVCDDFQELFGISVSSDARHELIEPGLPYEDQVRRELATGEVTEEFLRHSVTIVLVEAWRVAKEMKRDTIGEPTVREAMRRYCPYLFWC